jgi:O-antigen ligase
MGNAKPLFGFGPRTYKFYYGNFQTREDLTYTSTFNGNKGHSHSDYLSYLAENGYPGFIIHILLYLIIIYQSLNTIRTCISKQNRTLALIGLLSLITYIIHGMFNGFMEDEKMASLVYMSMAMIVFAQLNEKDLKESKEKTNTTI